MLSQTESEVNILLLCCSLLLLPLQKAEQNVEQLEREPLHMTFNVLFASFDILWQQQATEQ